MENFQITGSVSNAHVDMEQTWATMTWPVPEELTHKVLPRPVLERVIDVVFRKGGSRPCHRSLRE